LFTLANILVVKYHCFCQKICHTAAVGRKKVVECDLMSEIVRLLTDNCSGAELKETVLDLLASLCDAGKLKTLYSLC